MGSKVVFFNRESGELENTRFWDCGTVGRGKRYSPPSWGRNTPSMRLGLRLRPREHFRIKLTFHLDLQDFAGQTNHLGLESWLPAFAVAQFPVVAWAIDRSGDRSFKADRGNRFVHPESLY